MAILGFFPWVTNLIWYGYRLSGLSVSLALFQLSHISISSVIVFFLECAIDFQYCSFHSVLVAAPSYFFPWHPSLAFLYLAHLSITFFMKRFCICSEGEERALRLPLVFFASFFSQPWLETYDFLWWHVNILLLKLDNNGSTPAIPWQRR